MNPAGVAPAKAPGSVGRVGGAAPTLVAHAGDYLRRVRAGEMGALPAVAGILVLTAVFSMADDNFLTRRNFANLLTQGAPIMIIAMGMVFILLLGEIDLAAGYTSGVAGALLATLLRDGTTNTALALLVAVAAGAGIGLVHGTVVAMMGIPSFVVTLAGFLAWQGVVLFIVGQGGNIPIDNDVVNGIAGSSLPPWGGWVFVAVVVAGYAWVSLRRIAHLRGRELPVEPISVALARVAALCTVLALAVYVLNQNRSVSPLITLRGVPWVVPVIAVLLVIATFVLTRTGFGRHVYATGGNAEATRRAGIPVARIRVTVFVIGSTFAALGGVVAASRLQSVDPGAGGGNLLLFAIGAAVIGGTSLFGGRGKVRDAVLGGLVIAIIGNGMALVGWQADRQFIATGLVLLVAAGVDALSRRRAAARGLR